MKSKKTISILVFGIAVLAFIATVKGIFSSGGGGSFEFQSIHGQTVLIYGKGLYKNMSAASAPDGIAQDVVTLTLAIPMLLISLYYWIKGSLKGKLFLAGTLMYFLFTYLLYMVLTMYNEYFLVYVALTSLCFFAFILIMTSFDVDKIYLRFSKKLPTNIIGGFLIFIAIVVGLNWLNLILTPLMDGSFVPETLEHYTTMPVQGFDLAFMLPTAFIAGVSLLKKKPFAYLIAPVFTVFLVIMMTALSAKMLGQLLRGTEGALPVMFVFALFASIAGYCSYLIMKNVKEV
ncbi:hypothetical protein SH2C18_50390 [Clostridium sediminicola]|uniref:hypothetical protein n=1 Tax=Clostridium sediminicola TaxID=3114879 RepID=UPI0031F27E41